MTDERPNERLFQAFGVQLPSLEDRQEVTRREREEREAREREAARKELENQPPGPEKGPTMPKPGDTFFNSRIIETAAQREARLTGKTKEPEPPSLDKAAERVRQIEENRPARRMLAPWEKDPRWGA